MLEPWVISRPDLLGGKPCVRGARLSVELILELLASGASHEQILASYSHLTVDGLAAALRSADEPARGGKAATVPVEH